MHRSRLSGSRRTRRRSKTRTRDGRRTAFLPRKPSITFGAKRWPRGPAGDAFLSPTHGVSECLLLQISKTGTNGRQMVQRHLARRAASPRRSVTDLNFVFWRNTRNRQTKSTDYRHYLTDGRVSKDGKFSPDLRDACESLCSSVEKKKDFLRRPGRPCENRYDPNGRDSQRWNRQLYEISQIA